MPNGSAGTQRTDAVGKPSHPAWGKAGGLVLPAFLRAGIFLVLLPGAMQTGAQINLVPNPSFEDTSNCAGPIYSQIETALPWFTPTLGTPDLDFTDSTVACGGTPMFLTYPPSVDQGFQSAFHGQRFVAFYLAVYPTDHKEYVGVRLTSPLNEDVGYQVRFRSSRADGCDYAVDRMGVYFGPDSLYQADAMHLDVTPQIEFYQAGHFVESDSWFLLQDTFVAAGGEEWMYIGNFQDSTEVDLLFVPGSIGWNSAYYYFDSIQVAQVSEVGIMEIDLLPHFEAGSLWISGREACKVHRVEVLDQMGRIILGGSGGPCFATQSIRMPGTISTGIYLIRGILRDGVVWTGRCLWEGRSP